jgi:hypothetical protein
MGLEPNPITYSAAIAVTVAAGKDNIIFIIPWVAVLEAEQAVMSPIDYILE